MKPYYIFFFTLALFSCKNIKNTTVINEDYVLAIEENKVERAENRINYLQLIGLFKMDSINNRFGNDNSNTFIFNIDGAAPRIGSVQKVDSTLIFKAEKEVIVKTKDGEIVTDLILDLDQYGSSKRLYHRDLNWQVITRSNQNYLRVWHENNPAADTFKGFEHFDINPELIFDASFTYYESAKSEIVKSEVDGQRSTKFIGYVSFGYMGEAHTLDVGLNGFTMVSDETTGNGTYGGGRYIYLDLPESNGSITLDFNYLYNPPCSFSKFTTCLYPPRQNYLSFEVIAGERITFKGNEFKSHQNEH